MEPNEQSNLSCNNSSDMNHLIQGQIQHSLIKVEQCNEEKVKDNSQSGQIHQQESSSINQQLSRSEIKKLDDSYLDHKQLMNSKIQQSLSNQDQIVPEQFNFKSQYNQKLQQSGQLLSNQSKNKKSSQLKISDSNSKKQKSDSFRQQSQFQEVQKQLNVGISDKLQKFQKFGVNQISSYSFKEEELQIFSWISIISPNIKKVDKISKYCEDYILQLKENEPKLLQFLNNLFQNNGAQIVKYFKINQPRSQNAFELANDDAAMLCHLNLSGRCFHMDQFLQRKWQYLAFIEMRCCQINDKMWSQLSNNIDNFPNLVSLDLTFNLIQTVVQSDLTKFNNLNRFKLVRISDNPLHVKSQIILGKWRNTLKKQKQATVEFSLLDLKNLKFKFSNLAKQQPKLMNLIQQISFAKKQKFDNYQWQAVVFYMKSFPLLIKLDLSENQIAQIKFGDLEKVNLTIQKRKQVLNQKLTINLIGNPLSQESCKQIRQFYQKYPYSSLILTSSSTPKQFHLERVRLLTIKNIYRILLEMSFKKHKLSQQITSELFETISEQFLIRLNNNQQFQKVRAMYLEIWKYVKSQFKQVHKPNIKEKHQNNFKELLNSFQNLFNKAKVVYESLFQ